MVIKMMITRRHLNAIAKKLPLPPRFFKPRRIIGIVPTEDGTFVIRAARYSGMSIYTEEHGKGKLKIYTDEPKGTDMSPFWQAYHAAVITAAALSDGGGDGETA